VATVYSKTFYLKDKLYVNSLVQQRRKDSRYRNERDRINEEMLFKNVYERK
jgi:hypothetical protein